jgi:hypothetical protein
MHGFTARRCVRQQRRRHRSARRHYDHGQRLAVLRALTAASLRLNGAFSSLAQAAAACGSGVVYVKAAVAILRSEDVSIRDQVLTGRLSLLAAASLVEKRSKIVAAYRQATAADRVAFAKTIGPTVLFDNDLVPAM